MQENLHKQRNNYNLNSHETKSVLVVSDLPENATKEDVELFFEEFKDFIVYIELRTSKIMDFSNRSNSATIIFNDNNQANKARLELNLRKIKGKSVRITWHEKDNSLRYSNQFNLYIKNVPKQVTPREYFEHFLKFGDVISAKLAENDDGEHLGYGYVHYTNSESVKKCIENTDEKEIWSGSKIKVEQFQKKNERDLANPEETNPSSTSKDNADKLNTKKLNNNTTVFVQNFPENFDEKDFKDNIFKGLNVISISILEDKSRNKRSAIVVFETEEDATKAKEKNNTEFTDSKSKEVLKLVVDTYFTKLERKRYIYNKITEHNLELSGQFRGCNLYVKNLPLDLSNDEFKQIFSEFGELKSAKIKTQIICTKVNNNIVEKESSCGFGYVCFTDAANANKALEALNGKFILEDKFPDHKKALEITYFAPANERKQQELFNNNNNSNIIGNRGNIMGMPLNNFGTRNMPYSGGHNNYNKSYKNNYNNKGYNNKGYNNNYNKGHNNYNNNYNNNNININNNNVNNNTVYNENQIINTEKRIDEPDYSVLSTMDDEGSKREYLGEFIFKKIEANELTEQYKLTFDDIGKITGMILGIGDINEIIDICRNKQHLTSRIVEALELLKMNA